MRQPSRNTYFARPLGGWTFDKLRTNDIHHSH
jgi:hypothetical protein